MKLETPFSAGPSPQAGFSRGKSLHLEILKESGPSTPVQMLSARMEEHDGSWNRNAAETRTRTSAPHEMSQSPTMETHHSRPLPGATRECRLDPQPAAPLDHQGGQSARMGLHVGEAVEAEISSATL